VAQLKRSEIITLARKWSGRKAQLIDLPDEFDFIVRDMSIQHPLLRTTETGSLTADQNYIAVPTDYRSQDIFITGSGYPTALKIGTNWLPFLKSQAEFYELDDTMHGTPVLYMIMEDPGTSKIYFYPHLETLTPAYKFLYYKIHPKSWSVWAGLTDKTDIEFDNGEIKTIISGAEEFDVDACRAGREITVTGSVANDGTYTILSATAAAIVVVETLIMDELPGAAVTITVESEDDYLHLYGENWDHVVANGVAMRAGNITKEADIEAKYEARYLAGLSEMNALVKARPYLRTVYHDF